MVHLLERIFALLPWCS